MSKLWLAAENEHEESVHYDAYQKPQPPGDGVTDFIESPAEMVTDGQDSLTMAEDAAKTAFEQISIIQGIQDSLGSKSFCSDAYMTSLENYRPVVEQLMGNLGALRAIPSTEDFLSVHRAQVAHHIANESLGDFVKKTWEKVKEFFALFFKKMALYLKRMVKANLELEDYEKYLEPMMAKLRSGGNNTKPTDVSEFDSKLPMILADEGMEKMDAEYLMNYGVRKVDRLLTVMDRIGFKGVGKLNDNDGLPMLTEKVRAFATMHGGGTHHPLAKLKADAMELQQFALSVVTSSFEHLVNDPRELPEEVYQAIHDAFNHAQMGEGFAIRSLEPHNSGRDGLPKNANIFLAHSATGAALVSGHIGTNTYVRNLIAPPASFKSLQGMHDFYKSRIAKTKVQVADRTLDKTNDLIMKLLGVLSKDFSKMVDNVSAAAKNGASRDLAELMVAASNRGMTATSIMNTVMNKFQDVDLSSMVTDPDYGDVFQRFMQMPIQDNDYYRRQVRQAFEEKLRTLMNNYGASLDQFNIWLEEELSGGAPSQSPQELQEAKEVIKDLSRILTNLLTNLQSILRFVMTSVYGVYTELRYEFVRYLYLSAQRYRVT